MMYRIAWTNQSPRGQRSSTSGPGGNGHQETPATRNNRRNNRGAIGGDSPPTGATKVGGPAQADVNENARKPAGLSDTLPCGTIGCDDAGVYRSGQTGQTVNLLA